jgi:hypothetical protein
MLSTLDAASLRPSRNGKKVKPNLLAQIRRES